MAMESDRTEEVKDEILPPFPDLRQTLCHTLLAAAFALLWVFNPISGKSVEHKLPLWVMVFIVGFAISSWVVVLRARSAWLRAPSHLRLAQSQTAALDKNRAQSHGLMAALSLLLTGFAFLAGAFIPEITEGVLNRILFGAAVLVATLSAAVLTRAVRDLFIQRKL